MRSSRTLFAFSISEQRSSNILQSELVGDSNLPSIICSFLAFTIGWYMLSGSELSTVGLTERSDALCFCRCSRRIRAIVCLLISGMALSILLFKVCADLNYNFQNSVFH